MSLFLAIIVPIFCIDRFMPSIVGDTVNCMPLPQVISLGISISQPTFIPYSLSNNSLLFQGGQYMSMKISWAGVVFRVSLLFFKNCCNWFWDLCHVMWLGYINKQKRHMVIGIYNPSQHSNEHQHTHTYIYTYTH